MRLSVACACTMALALVANSQAEAAEIYGLTPGPVELKSAGPMCFGPSNVLFVGDPKAAKVYALNTEDSGTSKGHFEVDDVGAKLKAALKVEANVVDLAVNPETGNAFVSITAGEKGMIAKILSDGSVQPLNLDKIGHASATVPNAPEDKWVQTRRRKTNPRMSSITDIAYNDGKVLVSGLKAGDAPSAVREFDFPFREQSQGMSVQIYHAAHGKEEDYAPIRTFVPFNIGGKPNLLAGYTCTPLVKIPVTNISSEDKISATTVAELGNRNTPLDMIVYENDGKTYLLMANDRRGVMKISTDDLERENGLTERVSGGGTAGQKYETISDLEGVVQLDKVDDSHAMVMTQAENGKMSLMVIDLP